MRDPVRGGLELIVPLEAEGERLGSFLPGRLPQLARPQVARLIETGGVLVDGVARPGAYRLRASERLAARWCLRNPGGIEPEEGPLDVRFEDADLLVVAKPAGQAVHPAIGHWAGTLANVVVGHWWRRGEFAARFGPAHRLDRDTSGLLAIGKHRAATAALGAQLARRTLRRTYLALVVGVPVPREGLIDLPLARDPANRFRTVVRPDGQPARTRYRVVEALAGKALIELALETGRTHQIRAHLAALGHPIVGDRLYGWALPEAAQAMLPGRGAARPLLHAHWLALRHPRTGEALAFVAEPPEDFQQALACARRLAAPE